MNRYVIERDLPGVGGMTPAEVRAAAQTSNIALSEIGSGIQWVESHITEDRIYCVYLADSAELVREHARLAGLPATEISRVIRVIDPLAGTPADL